MSDKRNGTSQILEENRLLEENRRLRHRLQAMEAERRRRQSLEEVREKVWAMGRARDMQQVLEEVRRCLEGVGVAFAFCGLNVIDVKRRPPLLRCHTLEQGAEWTQYTIENSEKHPLVHIWRGGRLVYRPDLEREDPFGERENFAHFFGKPIRAVLDVPFSHGTLAINSTQPDSYGPEDLKFLAEVVEVLSEGFRRLDDLEDLERARMRAEASSQIKSRFLKVMNHELRTPLNAIIGFSEMLDQSAIGPLNPRQKHYVNTVLNNGRKLLGLIDDVFDLARAEDGEMELKTQPFAPADVVEKAVALVAERARAKGVDLQFAPGEGLPLMRGDVQKFRQMVYQLVDNAVRFTEAGGRVRVGTRVGEEGFHLAVADTGIGLSEEDRERIFYLFEQGEDVQTDKQGGRGIGLALVLRLAKLHGGRVWAESAGQGQGSTFHLVLPVAAEAVQERREELAESI